MPDIHILDDAELEERMKSFTDRQLSEFTLRQVTVICRQYVAYGKRIKDLEDRDRKTFGLIGGLGAFFGTAVGAAASYIWEKLSGK